MGVGYSQRNFSIYPNISQEVEASLNQILHAFDHDISFQSEHNTDHLSTEKESSNTQTKRSNLQHHRSRSLDHSNLAEQHRFVRKKPSVIKRQWQCQFCLTRNETDAQLCTECGSNKINVYIPVMDHLDRNTNKNHHHQHKSLFTPSSSSASSSSTTRRQSRNVSNKNENFALLEEENIHRRSVLVAHKREVDEHIVLRHVDKILRTCVRSHSKFKDENFPASPHSLYINGSTLSKSTLTLLPGQQQTNLNTTSINNIQWLRPDQIIPEEWEENVRTQWAVYRDPKPNDVLQGTLGDCWFITALSVLAEEPEYLTRVLITKQYNYEGIYCVRLCKDGEWTQVLVDDRLPCTSDRRLAYSQAQRKQLWVPLIEKALAKLNGSYEAIIAGRCCEGLATVTGSPCETLILGRSNNPDDKNVDYDRLWAKLLHSRLQKFLMCAMCSNNLISREEFDKYGLLNIHAYSLQDVKQSKDGRHKLVKLRNPWGGTYRWTGDWSDNSRLWHDNPDLRRELLDEKRNKRDGVFWMPFVSFVRYFECVDICKLRHNWYEVRDTANFYPAPKMMQAYYLTLSHSTELDIALHRKISKNLRIHRSDVSLCIAIINMEEQPHGNYRIYSIPIISQRGQHKFISTDGYLSPGTYVILPLLSNPINKYLDNTEFTIAIHSSHAIDLERIRIPLRIEREFLIKLCIFYGDQVRTANSSDRDTNHSDGVTIYELKKYWNGLMVLVENRHPTKYVHFHFNCTVSQNAFISRKDSQNELFDIIPPNYRQIIVSITRQSPSHSFTIGHDFQYNLSSHDYIKHGEGFKLKHWPKIDEDQLNDDLHTPQSISSAKQY
ncbi:unnamed protein product [Adineta steineri]|uniref:Calpain-like protein n=1 Tax=Adineta steineri TaxID=433720 RepID=A0A815B442_9BILA|nr:unnamed protein product [Adineta steineri]CAF1265613.1 unnamed protein product [Adineta steineri]